MKNNQSQWQQQAAQAAAEHRAKEEARAGEFILETQHAMGRRCLVHD